MKRYGYVPCTGCYFPCLPSYNYNFLPLYLVRNRNYPPVDPSKLEDSAKQCAILLKEAETLTNTFSSSSSFSQTIMEAAQKNDREQVKKQLTSLGINHLDEVHYTPDGIQVILLHSTEKHNCTLTIALHW